MGSKKPILDLCRLELVRSELPGIIHAKDIMIPTRRFSRLGASVTAIGLVGPFAGNVAVCWYVSNGRAMCNPSSAKLALAVVGCVSSMICFVFYLAQAQRVLLRRLFKSLDAWYVSYQFTIFTVGISDVLFWDERIWFVWSAWIWCHWCLLEDTLTPVTRRQLSLHHPLTVLVHVGLLVHPVNSMHWIFFPNAPKLRNRVFLHTTIFEVPIHMEANSMLVSRIVTIWFWMDRFLWRALVYPRDVFKLLKYRVQYYPPQNADQVPAPRLDTRDPSLEPVS